MDMPKRLNISKEDEEFLNKAFRKLHNRLLKRSIDELFIECEHGNEEHRKWLKDKFNDFLERKVNES